MVLIDLVKKFKAIDESQFDYFDKSIKRTVLISEGRPRFNDKLLSENVLDALKKLTERNN